MLSHGYPPTLSGVTLVVQKVARALVAHGHAVQVVTASKRGASSTDEDEGVQVVRLRSLRNPFWSEGRIPWVRMKRLKELVEAFAPDLIHTHENAVLSFQLLRLPRSAGVPRIASCYFLPHFVTHYVGGGRTVIGKAVEAIIWRYGVTTLNRYDHVIFSTPTHR
jgi:glycosyltransferase involved in cell wall biosynthesis